MPLHKLFNESTLQLSIDITELKKIIQFSVQFILDFAGCEETSVEDIPVLRLPEEHRRQVEGGYMGIGVGDGRSLFVFVQRLELRFKLQCQSED